MKRHPDFDELKVLGFLSLMMSGMSIITVEVPSTDFFISKATVHTSAITVIPGSETRCLRASHPGLTCSQRLVTTCYRTASKCSIISNQRQGYISLTKWRILQSN